MSAAKKYFHDIYAALSSTLIGMAVTGRNALTKPVTELYPHQKYIPQDRYRGILFNKIEDCSGCAACARACPVDCIYIQSQRRDPEDFTTASDGSPVKLWVTQFDIDMSLCMLCGLCTEPCPTGAIRTTKQYEMATANKGDLYLRFAKDAERAKAAAIRSAERKKAEEAAKAAEAAKAGEAATDPSKPAGASGGEGKEGTTT